MKQNKRTAGFTLVELIVVIAIMGILAGVGTVGYGAYVKSAAKKADISTVSNIVRALDTANNSGFVMFDVADQYAAGLQIPVGYIVLSNEPLADGSYINVVTPGTVSNSDGSYSASDPQTNSPDSALVSAITAAYGNNYSTSLKLQYDGWSPSDYASFFASAGDMVEVVDEMGTNVLSLLKAFGSNYNDGKLTIRGSTKQVISQDYKDSAHLMSVFAGKIAALDKDTFVDDWVTLDSETDAFGLNSEGREHYSAARAAYSQCFASYVKKQGDNPSGLSTHNATTHASQISSYGDSAGTVISDEFGGGWLVELAVNGVLAVVQKEVTFPKAVCSSTFTSVTEDSSDFNHCSTCQALYSQYVNDGHAKTDAEAFYDTMATGAAEGIYDPNNPNPTEFFSWMNANAESFADLYTQIEGITNNKSSIALSVYYQDGKLVTNVNPLEADNR